MGRAGPAEWETTQAVDHHCHPLRRWPPLLTAFDLRAAFSEALDPRFVREHTPCTAAYRSALRRLGEELGCAPPEEAIRELRRREGPAAHGNQLLGRRRAGLRLLRPPLAGDDHLTGA